MKVTVKFYAYLPDKIGGYSVIELYLENSAKVSHVLSKLCENVKIREVLLGENQELKDDITLLKNGREIKFLDGLNTSLDEGDVIAVFPLVAGGNQTV